MFSLRRFQKYSQQMRWIAYSAGCGIVSGIRKEGWVRGGVKRFLQSFLNLIGLGVEFELFSDLPEFPGQFPDKCVSLFLVISRNYQRRNPIGFGIGPGEAHQIGSRQDILVPFHFS